MWFRKSDLKRMRKTFEERRGDAEYQATHREDPPLNDELQEALHQLMAVSVVLEEQERQRDLQINDPDLISDKYRQFVMRSRRSMFLSNLSRTNNERLRRSTLEPREGLLSRVDDVTTD